MGRTYSCWMLNCWFITWPVGFKRLMYLFLTRNVTFRRGWDWTFHIFRSRILLRQFFIEAPRAQRGRRQWTALNSNCGHLRFMEVLAFIFTMFQCNLNYWYMWAGQELGSELWRILPVSLSFSCTFIKRGIEKGMRNVSASKVEEMKILWRALSYSMYINQQDARNSCD